MGKKIDLDKVFMDGQREQVLALAAETIVRSPATVADLMDAMRLCGELRKVGIGIRQANMLLRQRVPRLVEIEKEEPE